MNDRRTLLIVGLVLVCVCAYCLHDRIWPEADPEPSPTAGPPFVGELEWASDVWEGDGWVSVIRTCVTPSGGVYKARVYVAVVGWPSETGETDLALHTVTAVHELVGKRVRIHPRQIEPYIVADRIEELSDE